MVIDERDERTRDSKELWLRYSETLHDWIRCDSTDRGAVKFVRAEELYAENCKLRAALQEAHLQLDYLNRKFPKTGTTETTLARLRAALDGR